MERTLIIAEDEAACKLFDCLVAYNKLINKVVPPKTSNLEDTVTIGVYPTSEMPAVETKTPKSV